MVHLSPDRNTKKSFIEDLKAGKEFSVYQPGIFPISNNGTGVFVIEAPANYHKWYTAVLCKDCKVLKVLTEKEQKEEYRKNQRV
jgi:hypothetical protein